MLDTNHQVIAGAGAQVDVIMRRAPIARDRDGEFKKALAASHEDPQGATVVSKAQDDAQEIDLTRPDACAKLIQRAHTSGAPWQPFAESQEIAKHADIAAGGGRIVRIFKEGGETRFEVVSE